MPTRLGAGKSPAAKCLRGQVLSRAMMGGAGMEMDIKDTGFCGAMRRD